MYAYFFACLLAVLLFALVHPFVTYPLSLSIARLLGIGDTKEARSIPPQTFSIVFCAYNEAKVIESKIENLRKIREIYGRDRIELLAYSDGCNDGTREALESADSEFIVVYRSERRGKSNGMNELLGRATGEIVIFTDANVLLDLDVVSAFEEVFTDGNIGLACGHLKYINRETATADVGTTYWELEERIKQLETDTGSSIGADGSLFAIRHNLYSPVLSDIIDDFFTSMNILCKGYRTVRCGKAIAYERSTDNLNDENLRKIRIGCRALNCHRLLRPQLRKLSIWNQYKYFSHKWLRWHAIFWLAGAWLCSIALLGLVGWGSVIAFCILSLSGLIAAFVAHKWRVTVLSKAWVGLSSLYATGRGIVHSWKGRRYQTWTPPQSSRAIGDSSEADRITLT